MVCDGFERSSAPSSSAVRIRWEGSLASEGFSLRGIPSLTSYRPPVLEIEAVPAHGHEEEQ